MDKITGKQNQLIKDTKKLLVSAKARRDTRSFVLEGARLCFDVLHSFYTVSLVLVTADCMERYPTECERLFARADRAVEISREVADRLAETEHTQGIFCVCQMPRHNPTVEEGRYIALDGVQDPSNLGAIARSAEALGIAGLLAYHCCDVYNPKALRASMGSLLRLPVTVSDDLREDLLLYKTEGFQVFGTVPDDTASAITETRFSKSAICVIGNEGNGMSEPVKLVCDDLLTIPMKGRAESLNASVAAALTMWEMMR